MPVEIKYDQSREVLDVSITGTPNLDELSSALEDIMNSDDYHPDSKIIWDIRKANVSSTNYQFISELVKIRSQFTRRKNGRSVLVVSSNAQYGIGRMLQMLSESKISGQFMVFHDYEEGEKWLLES